MENDTPELRREFLRFFSNPAIGIAGSLASIVGLVLAVYFYNAARTTRVLVYFVHPAKAAVVKAGQSSRLHITLDGAPVERDVIAAQVAFWNEGEESIRLENMLRPLVIRTSPTAQILEAHVRKVSRSVVDLNLDPAKSMKASCALTGKFSSIMTEGLSSSSTWAMLIPRSQRRRRLRAK